MLITDLDAVGEHAAVAWDRDVRTLPDADRITFDRVADADHPFYNVLGRAGVTHLCHVGGLVIGYLPPERVPQIGKWFQVYQLALTCAACRRVVCWDFRDDNWSGLCLACRLS